MAVSGRSRWRKILPVAVVLLGSALVFPDIWVLHRGSFWILKTTAIKSPDLLVVPGASVLRNGKPSPILRQRIQEALWGARRWPQAKVILSGTVDGGYDEPVAMRRYLMEHGVDSGRILLDRQGRSTRETMENLGEPQGSLVVVSQAWHLPRALWIARGLGWDAWGLEAGSGSPSGWDNLLREHAGRAWNFWLSFVPARPAKVVLLAPIQ